MRLRDGGIDIFYIDESHDVRTYVVTAMAIPFMRQVDGIWTITWPSHFAASKAWRREIKFDHKIPVSREMHGVKLISGRGRYLHGKWSFPKPKAASVYRDVLTRLRFIPDASVISVAVRRGAELYGASRLGAAMHALFQRMRVQCLARKTNAIVFFDAGHPEYRKLYRKAQIYLPTGSRLGGWEQGAATRNMPLDMFTKDANDKDSRHCHFTQIVDLIAYAAFLKIKGEHNELEAWQAQYNLGNLYDSVPRSILNLRASARGPQDAIVRIF